MFHGRYRLWTSYHELCKSAKIVELCLEICSCLVTGDTDSASGENKSVLKKIHDKIK